jgi:hypothetical protein
LYGIPNEGIGLISGLVGLLGRGGISVLSCAFDGATEERDKVFGLVTSTLEMSKECDSPRSFIILGGAECVDAVKHAVYHAT